MVCLSKIPINSHIWFLISGFLVHFCSMSSDQWLGWHPRIPRGLPWWCGWSCPQISIPQGWTCCSSSPSILSMAAIRWSVDPWSTWLWFRLEEKCPPMLPLLMHWLFSRMSPWGSWLTVAKFASFTVELGLDRWQNLVPSVWSGFPWLPELGSSTNG